MIVNYIEMRINEKHLVYQSSHLANHKLLDVNSNILVSCQCTKDPECHMHRCLKETTQWQINLKLYIFK